MADPIIRVGADFSQIISELAKLRSATGDLYKDTAVPVLPGADLDRGMTSVEQTVAPDVIGAHALVEATRGAASKAAGLAGADAAKAFITEFSALTNRLTASLISSLESQGLSRLVPRVEQQTAAAVGSYTSLASSGVRPENLARLAAREVALVEARAGLSLAQQPLEVRGGSSGYAVYEAGGKQPVTEVFRGKGSKGRADKELEALQVQRVAQYREQEVAAEEATRELIEEANSIGSRLVNSQEIKSVGEARLTAEKSGLVRFIRANAAFDERLASQLGIESKSRAFLDIDKDLPTKEKITAGTQQIMAGVSARVGLLREIGLDSEAINNIVRPFLNQAIQLFANGIKGEFVGSNKEQLDAARHEILAKLGSSGNLGNYLAKTASTIDSYDLGVDIGNKKVVEQTNRLDKQPVSRSQPKVTESAAKSKELRKDLEDPYSLENIAKLEEQALAELIAKRNDLIRKAIGYSLQSEEELKYLHDLEANVYADEREYAIKSGAMGQQVFLARMRRDKSILDAYAIEQVDLQAQQGLLQSAYHARLMEDKRGRGEIVQGRVDERLSNVYLEKETQKRLLFQQGQSYVKDAGAANAYRRTVGARIDEEESRRLLSGGLNYTEMAGKAAANEAQLSAAIEAIKNERLLANRQYIASMSRGQAAQKQLSAVIENESLKRLASASVTLSSGETVDYTTALGYNAAQRKVLNTKASIEEEKALAATIGFTRSRAELAVLEQKRLAREQIAEATLLNDPKNLARGLIAKGTVAKSVSNAAEDELVQRGLRESQQYTTAKGVAAAEQEATNALINLAKAKQLDILASTTSYLDDVVEAKVLQDELNVEIKAQVALRAAQRNADALALAERRGVAGTPLSGAQTDVRAFTEATNTQMEAQVSAGKLRQLNASEAYTNLLGQSAVSEAEINAKKQIAFQELVAAEGSLTASLLARAQFEKAAGNASVKSKFNELVLQKGSGYSEQQGALAAQQTQIDAQITSQKLALLGENSLLLRLQASNSAKQAELNAIQERNTQQLLAANLTYINAKAEGAALQRATNAQVEAKTLEALAADAEYIKATVEAAAARREIQAAQTKQELLLLQTDPLAGSRLRDSSGDAAVLKAEQAAGRAAGELGRGDELAALNADEASSKKRLGVIKKREESAALLALEQDEEYVAASRQTAINEKELSLTKLRRQREELEALAMEQLAGKNVAESAGVAALDAQIQRETLLIDETKLAVKQRALAGDVEALKAIAARKVAEEQYSIALNEQVAIARQEAGLARGGSGGTLHNFWSRFKTQIAGGGSGTGGGGRLPGDDAMGGVGGFFGSGFATSLKYMIPSMLMFSAGRGILETVKAAENLQVEFARVESQFEASFGDKAQGMLEKFKQSVLGISKSTGVSADDVAAMGRQFAGVFGEGSDVKLRGPDNRIVTGGQDLVEDQMRVASQIQALNGVTRQEAVDSLTAISTSFDVTGERIANVTQRIADLSGVEQPEIFKAVADAAPAAQAAGFSLEEFASILATVQQRSGKSGSAIAEGFNRILPAIVNNKKQLLELAAIEPKLKTNEFVSAVTGNQNDQVLKILARNFDSLKKQSQDQIIEALGGRREANILLPMLKNRDLSDKYEAGAVDDSAQTAWEERIKKFDATLSRTIKRLGTGFKELGYIVYDSGLDDALKLIVQLLDLSVSSVKVLLKAFGGFNDMLGGVPARVLAIVAAVKALEAIWVRMSAEGTLLGSLAQRGAAGRGPVSSTTGMEMPVGAAAAFAMGRTPAGEEQQAQRFRDLFRGTGMVGSEKLGNIIRGVGLASGEAGSKIAALTKGIFSAKLGFFGLLLAIEPATAAMKKITSWFASLTGLDVDVEKSDKEFRKARKNEDEAIKDRLWQINKLNDPDVRDRAVNEFLERASDSKPSGFTSVAANFKNVANDIPIVGSLFGEDRNQYGSANAQRKGAYDALFDQPGVKELFDSKKFREYAKGEIDSLLKARVKFNDEVATAREALEWVAKYHNTSYESMSIGAVKALNKTELGETFLGGMKSDQKIDTYAYLGKMISEDLDPGQMYNKIKADSKKTKTDEGGIAIGFLNQLKKTGLNDEEIKKLLSGYVDDITGAKDIMDAKRKQFMASTVEEATSFTETAKSEYESGDMSARGYLAVLRNALSVVKLGNDDTSRVLAAGYMKEINKVTSDLIEKRAERALQLAEVLGGKSEDELNQMKIQQALAVLKNPDASNELKDKAYQQLLEGIQERKKKALKDADTPEKLAQLSKSGIELTADEQEAIFIHQIKTGESVFSDAVEAYKQVSGKSADVLLRSINAAKKMGSKALKELSVALKKELVLLAQHGGQIDAETSAYMRVIEQALNAIDGMIGVGSGPGWFSRISNLNNGAAYGASRAKVDTSSSDVAQNRIDLIGAQANLDASRTADNVSRADIMRKAAVAKAWAVAANKDATAPDRLAALTAVNEAERAYQDALQARSSAVLDLAKSRTRDPARQAQLSRTQALSALAYARKTGNRDAELAALGQLASADEAIRGQQEDVLNAKIAFQKEFFSGDSLKQARLGQEDALRAYNDAARLGLGEAAQWNALAAKVRADRAVEDAATMIREAQMDYLQALANASGNNVEAARIGVQRAQEQLNKIQAGLGTRYGEKELTESKTNLVNQQSTLRGNQLNQAKDDIQFALDMKQITTGEAVNRLTQLLAIYGDNQQYYRDIQRTINSLKGQLQNQQFNLPELLHLPTLYEVRRLNQLGSAGPGGSNIGYQDNRQMDVKIYVNNGNGSLTEQQVVGAIREAIGADGRSGTYSKRY